MGGGERDVVARFVGLCYLFKDDNIEDGIYCSNLPRYIGVNWNNPFNKGI